jgi:hypothetical protein
MPQRGPGFAVELAVGDPGARDLRSATKSPRLIKLKSRLTVATAAAGAGVVAALGDKLAAAEGVADGVAVAPPPQAAAPAEATTRANMATIASREITRLQEPGRVVLRASPCSCQHVASATVAAGLSRGQ